MPLGRLWSSRQLLPRALSNNNNNNRQDHADEVYGTGRYTPSVPVQSDLPHTVHQQVEYGACIDVRSWFRSRLDAEQRRVYRLDIDGTHRSQQAIKLHDQGDVRCHDAKRP